MSVSVSHPLSPLAAETWHLALSQTDGRDKLFRLAQYLCRLLRGAYVGRRSPSPSTPAARLAALESALATSRQIWRLFKWTSVYAKSKPKVSALRAAPALPHVTALLADAAMFCYYLTDNLSFMHKANVVRGDARLATRRAAHFWLASVVAGLAGSLHAVGALGREERALRARLDAAARAKKEEGVGGGDDGVDDVRVAYRAVLRRKRQVLAGCVKHGGDAVVAWSLGREQPAHPAVVGACGTVSSAVGLWQVWPRGGA